jgi:hypothetical protein
MQTEPIAEQPSLRPQTVSIKGQRAKLAIKTNKSSYKSNPEQNFGPSMVAICSLDAQSEDCTAPRTLKEIEKP